MLVHLLLVFLALLRLVAMILEPDLHLWKKKQRNLVSLSLTEDFDVIDLGGDGN